MREHECYRLAPPASELRDGNPLYHNNRLRPKQSIQTDTNPFVWKDRIAGCELRHSRRRTNFLNYGAGGLGGITFGALSRSVARSHSRE